ncbi:MULTISPECIES: leucine-rich repeat protein [unclassified Paenibacillus]|uniref:leucine-rich repeat protein n=1 Tax=unclassified Paenibacillus TaxID=185978 RepID=UPI0024060E90|nr:MULTISPECIES: leucine-rich repeat protein [unclassified Paenibacillus]MDF9840772.1 tetratricopeptide (TPR) repeat protein [Paenibacillus sp. PastF-2]MDF9847355.1 tetratricopeptide (TPR) repeat protein [Paenibacillus sp. PastM-2]MDF9854067.1 tetratricopeptide (TPR) repeat protein [Paenibacillus sp. PastF-1]MDH6479340.1 tetratricopeptide (TPR) repeat protein [Paenibacillus sp. PastH-2]MDH6506927.1 tetratricopeptide (TPR) repeat protein [Paenibacillus sp. PastM-3]
MSIGRNEPCLCQSGKKYKKCCGQNGNNNPIKVKMNWPKYTYDPQNQTPQDEFQMTVEGLSYIGKREVVYVPEVLDGQAVTAIAERGFAGLPVREVYLPPALEGIGNEAFESCLHLRTIAFPPGLKKIGRFAFQDCKNLSAIYLYDELEILDGYAFDGCTGLKAARLPSRIDYIGAYAFSETGLKQIVLPAGMQFLGNSLFYNCTELERVYFQEGLEVIGNMSFANCRNLEAVYFPNSLQVIAMGAFQDCIRLREVLVQHNIKKVHDGAFIGCTNINKYISPFKQDVRVELYDLESEMLASFKITEQNPKPRFGFLASIILIEQLSGQRRIDLTHMLDTQSFTDQLLAEINNLFMLEINPLSKTNNELSDLEEFEIEEALEEDKEISALTDRYVGLLSAGVESKRAGNYKEAKEKYIEAIQLKPGESTAYYNLGKILYLNEEYEASVRSYKTALELGYNYAETLRHLGHSLLDKKNKENGYAEVIQSYMEGISPHLLKQKILDRKETFSVALSLEKEYNLLCIQAAEDYLEDKAQ